MAHQAHSISWNILAQNLHHRSAPASPDTTHLVSDLYFRFRPAQGKEIGYFAESFTRAVEEHTHTERRKYRAQYEPIHPDDLVLDDCQAENLRSLAYKWCTAYQDHKWPYRTAVKEESPKLCPHRDYASGSSLRRRSAISSTSSNSSSSSIDSSSAERSMEHCGCPLPYSERLGSAFLRRYRRNDCYKFMDVNAEAFYNMQVVSSLLLLGEMDPVLRLAATPGNDLAEWMEMYECYCMTPDRGWDKLLAGALQMYLTLNILYSIPELWDPASRQAANKKKSDGYRNTRIYQRTLRRWTFEGSSNEVAQYLHRRFFGLDGHFHWKTRVTGYRREPGFLPLVEATNDVRGARLGWLNDAGSSGETSSPTLVLTNRTFPYGQVPFDVFLNCGETAVYRPQLTDVARVEAYLRVRGGLPQELVEYIMALAEYDGQHARRLPVPHDPLHRANCTELREYLTRCWQVMVRCNMLAQEVGKRIDWVAQVVETLDMLVAKPPGKKLFKRELMGEYWEVTMAGGSGELPHRFRTYD
ncbi:hypothetical protein ASPACDRAFT_1891370 [Aspergillus aculeatus ATCC 16872]|uniref:Uncharacterized protein n=1 Tax=Aspergillus aculeatus (strain ATCC 16872 / CBS 172.66 / WB 5094) TaxID=690307 RepID=A0A1L9WIH0_ASPA1|nr:uncharacterized protein ASPACDRAFT_1891370 [Aspergillus aculeatus ATCC 16872]OJJ95953.1 hypothetical protein ASPACDRAFT_1891370 [Aspergillus aculeatus ATCC 16872]